MSDPSLVVHGLVKSYGALRPLRIASLALLPAQRVAVAGLDGPAAEVLVNLLTGATLPEAGEIRLFGRATAAITDADDWLKTLDRFGIVSVRALLLGELTTAQSIAMSFTLSIDPVPARVLADVSRLAAEVGLTADLPIRVGDLPPAARARIHVARALALDPALLVLEHANALVAGGPPGAPARLARDVARIARRRGIALLALTADPAFARAVAHDVFTFDAATGTLLRQSGWRRWIGG